MRINEEFEEVTEEEAMQLHFSDFDEGASIVFDADDGNYVITRNARDFTVKFTDMIQKKYWDNKVFSAIKYCEIRKCIVENIISDRMTFKETTIEEENGYCNVTFAFQTDVFQINLIVSFIHRAMEIIEEIIEEMTIAIDETIHDHLRYMSKKMHQ